MAPMAWNSRQLLENLQKDKQNCQVRTVAQVQKERHWLCKKGKCYSDVLIQKETSLIPEKII